MCKDINDCVCGWCGAHSTNGFCSTMCESDCMDAYEKDMEELERDYPICPDCSSQVDTVTGSCLCPEFDDWTCPDCGDKHPWNMEGDCPCQLTYEDVKE